MEARELLIEYLKLKVHEEDWHGVADAAMDLRELDAYERGLDQLEHELDCELDEYSDVDPASLYNCGAL